MNALVRPFALLSLGLTLAACGGGPVTPPGTPVASLNDSGAGSLREAISAAAPGDTLRLTTSGTLTLTRPLVVDKDVTIVAKGVTVDAAGTGRALEIAKGVTVTVTGGTLKGGTGAVLPASVNIHRAEQPGPARQDPRADVHPDRIRLQATTTPPNVGGVLLNRGSLILDGVTVTGGRANLGGGIYNDAGATLTLRGTTTVTGNTATLLDPTDLTLAQGYGGGIYTLGTVNVNGGSVSGNTAVYSGGGLRGGVGSRMTVSGGKVDGNACTLPFTGTSAADADGCAGGGIFTRGDLSITGGSVTNNTATYFGGGVTVQATCTDATCTTLTYPTFTMSGGTVEGNATTGTADNGGGGLWLYSTGTISGGSIRGNRSMYGGGIDSWHDLNITGGAIENNTATENGGGVTLSHDGAYHIGGTARVTGNAAMNAGGGVYVTGKAQATMDGGQIAGNSVTGTPDGGGGVRISGSSAFTLAGGEIRDNTALKTGAGVTVGGQFTMTGGSITGNTVKGTTSTDNPAHQGGGGVRLYAGSRATMSGGTISGNRARWGAGVVIDGPYQTSPTSEFTLSGGTVSGNTIVDSSNVGGGFFNMGTLTITSGNVTGNTATQHGGGVYNSKTATYSQPGGSVSGNTPDDVYTSP
ncbi:hypothetical protein [Deinococcus sonorensis]|uniref:Right handed beta helix domain-containing protein n=1 Tax=Deinococcus sonorensis TaxID=309891 RepID=A0ABV8YFA8_9DEIO